MIIFRPLFSYLGKTNPAFPGVLSGNYRRKTRSSVFGLRGSADLSRPDFPRGKILRNWFVRALQCQCFPSLGMRSADFCFPLAQWMALHRERSLPLSKSLCRFLSKSMFCMFSNKPHRDARRVLWKPSHTYTQTHTHTPSHRPLGKHERPCNRAAGTLCGKSTRKFRSLAQTACRSDRVGVCVSVVSDR